MRTASPWTPADVEAALCDAVPAPPGLADRVVDFVSGTAGELARVPLLDIEATDIGVSRIAFGTGRSRAATMAARRHLEQARKELAEFFAADRGYFTVALDLFSVRPFQRAVLAAAGRIPLGEVRPYRWVAAGAGNDGAVRATGTALRTNPVPVILPCHRVVRSDGSLGGYAGGVPLKRRLLLIEGGIPGLVGRVDVGRVCRMGCSEEKGGTEASRVVVASMAEARASGYQPCPTCRPRDRLG